MTVWVVKNYIKNDIKKCLIMPPYNAIKNIDRSKQGPKGQYVGFSLMLSFVTISLQK